MGRPRMQLLPGFLCALFLWLSRGLDARTVDPLQEDRMGTTPAASTLYGGGSVYGAGSGAGARYRGGTASAGYGQRAVPAESARKIRNDERPYETPDTYEYMTNPSSKSSRTRVPETEKRPPGDDVELIYDRDQQKNGKNNDRDWTRDYGESRTSKRKTSAPKPGGGWGYGEQDHRYGYTGGGGTGPRYVDPDSYGYAGRTGGGGGGGGGPRFKDPPETKRYVSGNGEPVRPLPSSSSSLFSSGGKKSQRHDKKPAAPKKNERQEIDETVEAAVKKNKAKGGGSGKGDKNGRREEVDVVMDEPGKKKVHKKNEYLNKQEFFDEEHVKGPTDALVPEAAVAASGTSAARDRGKARKSRQDPRKKRKRRTKVKKKTKKRGNNSGSFGGNNDFGGSRFGGNNFGSSSFGGNNFGGYNFGSSASGSNNYAGRAVVRPDASTTSSSWSRTGRIVVVR